MGYIVVISPAYLRQLRDNAQAREAEKMHAASKLTNLLQVIREEAPSIPLPFLGLGVYRAWIEIAFVGTFIDFPTIQVAGHNAFDFAMIATMFAFAFLARRFTPLWNHRAVRRASIVALLLSTSGAFVALWYPETAPWLAWPCALLGGAGIAVLILLWSELYGKLAPMRICLYYSASLVVGAAIIWVYRGFMLPWLPVMTCLLPIVSLLMLKSCHARLQPQDSPIAASTSFTFPMKPIAVVAVYSFAFGLQEALAYADWGPHSSPGMVACAVAVVMAITLLPRSMAFESLYGTWLPLVSAAFLVLPAFGMLDGVLAGFCANLGYAASEIYVMTMIGSLCYHYNVSAVWLFGIERGVRAAAMMTGRLISMSASAAGTSVAPLVVLAVLAATFIVATERRVSSPWGVQVRSPESSEEAQAAAQRAALVQRCSELAGLYELSQREEEVLLLLAQGQSAGEIARELLVANGTVKAHVGHIYQKLGIHSREELFELTNAAATARAPYKA